MSTPPRRVARARLHARPVSVPGVLAVLVGTVLLAAGPLATGSASAASAPRVTSVGPRTGETTGGTRVVVKGARFARSTKVWFGSRPAAKVKRLSSAKLVAWTPAVSSARSVRLKVRSRGVTVRSRQRFAYRVPQNRVAPTYTDLGTDRLGADGVLARGQSLTAAGGAHRVALTADGALVLLARNGTASRVSGTPAGAARLLLRADGELVLLDAGDLELWSSGTGGGTAATLVMGADGVLRLLRGSVTAWQAVPVAAPGRGDDYPTRLRAAKVNGLVDPWRFYNRQCTSFVAWRMNSANKVAFSNTMRGPNGKSGRFGNAGDWAANATKIGYRVDRTPAVGAIAWWKGRHVAWVARVNGDGTVLVEEYNWAVRGGYGARTARVSDISGFIHVRDL